MKTKSIIQMAALLLLSTLNPQLSTVFAQGSLTPPGAPGPTMKSLDQIEARTAITNTASLVTISQPGSYYLTHNLTVSSGNAITIATNGVTLDLNGFTISSTAASAAGYGISLNGGLRNITLANGFVLGGVTNNGSGVYSGSGFAYGICYSGSAPVNMLVSRVSVSGCLYHGINLNTGDSTVVESCTVRTVGFYGIVASTIKSSSAIDCGNTAIGGGQVSDCRGQSPSGDGVDATTAQNCYGQSTSSYGLYAFTALNCYGYSNGSGYGLYASTALNCYGYGSGSGYGLYAPVSATGCYGYSYSGTGVSAFIANVCHGVSTIGTALSTTHNVNSY